MDLLYVIHITDLRVYISKQKLLIMDNYLMPLYLLFSVPPIRAKIVREWTFFSAGQAYNVSCQVLGSRPPAITAIYVGPSQLREVNYHVSTHNRKPNLLILT